MHSQHSLSNVPLEFRTASLFISVGFLSLQSTVFILNLHAERELENRTPNPALRPISPTIHSTTISTLQKLATLERQIFLKQGALVSAPLRYQGTKTGGIQKLTYTESP